MYRCSTRPNSPHACLSPRKISHQWGMLLGAQTTAAGVPSGRTPWELTCWFAGRATCEAVCHRTGLRRHRRSRRHLGPIGAGGDCRIRGDFSRWIGDVFGNRALAGELRALEERYRAGSRDEPSRKWQARYGAIRSLLMTNSKRWSVRSPVISRLAQRASRPPDRRSYGTRTAAPERRPARRSSSAWFASVSAYS